MNNNEDSVNLIGASPELIPYAEVSNPNGGYTVTIGE